MAHTGTADGGNEVFATTTPLPVAGSVGYTVRVLPHHPLLAGDNELGSGHAGPAGWQSSRVRCPSRSEPAM